MTLVSEIIRDAYREGNLIANNADPTSDEQTEGLLLLNRLVAYQYGFKAGEELEQIVIGRNNINRPADYPGYDPVPNETDWTVPANSRLMLNLTAAQTVYLPPNPDDGARFALIDKSANLATYPLTINANGRTIASATTATVSTNSAKQEYFYRADTGDWALVSPLEADNEFPFPTEFDDLFVIGLSIRLNPRHGVMLDDQSAATYRELRSAFKTRYRQHTQVGSELALVKTPGTSKHRYLDDTRANNVDFDSGLPR